MKILNRISAALSVAKPSDVMAKAYPESAFAPTQGFALYPRKVSLAAQGIFALRLEMMISEVDAVRVVQVAGTEFNLPSSAIFQEAATRNDRFVLHFSSRPEFGGAVIIIITNSVPLLEKIDQLVLAPPPPWIVFPELDPSTLGSLQGSIEYWWDWLFLPFWHSADNSTRERYLSKYPADAAWINFLSNHAQ